MIAIMLRITKRINACHDLQGAYSPACAGAAYEIEELPWLKMLIRLNSLVHLSHDLFQYEDRRKTPNSASIYIVMSVGNGDYQEP